LNPDPANGDLAQEAMEPIPSEWRAYSAAQPRPMELMIRAKSFGRRFWKIERPPHGAAVEEAGRTLYFAVFNPVQDSFPYECVITRPDATVIAAIREDGQKRRAGTKKLLGFIEYKAPRPEFAITDASGAEFCRIETSRNRAESAFETIYRMAFGGEQYHLLETTPWRRLYSPYKGHWAIFRADKRVAETSKLGWKGVMLQRVELSLASSEHLPPVMLLMLTWWIDKKSDREAMST